MKDHKLIIFIILFGMYLTSSFGYRIINSDDREYILNCVKDFVDFVMVPDQYIPQEYIPPALAKNTKSNKTKIVPIPKEIKPQEKESIKSIEIPVIKKSIVIKPKTDFKIVSSDNSKKTTIKKKGKKKEITLEERTASINETLNKYAINRTLPTIETAQYDKIHYGEFEIEANLHLNEKVKVFYALPVDSSGNAIKSANNVVFHAPYLSEGHYFARPFHRWFFEIAGYTLFSMQIKCTVNEVDDRNKMYYYPDKGWHDLVFKVKEEIEKKHNLENKKLLVTGESGGGSMAQMLGVHYADKIDAVAMVGGRFFDSPRGINSVAWLSVSTWGDPGIKQNKMFEGQMKKYNMQVLRAQTPPVWGKKETKHFRHAPSSTALNLIQYYIKAIVDLRTANKGKLPNYTEWGVSIGDEHFPSEDFAELWNYLPHEIIDDLENPDRDKNKKIILPSLTNKANKIVIFIHDNDLYSSTHILDNMYFLAERGCVVYSTEVSNDYFDTIKRIKSLVTDILANKELDHLPIYVSGSVCGGMLASVATFENPNERIKKIITLNSPFDWPFLDLTPILHRTKSDIPLECIYGRDSRIYMIPADKESFTKVSYIENTGLTLGKDWFNILDAIANQ